MTDRENFLSIAHRKGFERIPLDFNLCPVLRQKFDAYLAEHPEEKLNFYCSQMPGIPETHTAPEVFLKKYYPHKSFKAGTSIDIWGVGHEPGSPAAFHMTYMHHPMEDFDSVEQIMEYPFPVFHTEDISEMKKQADALHSAGRPVMGSMQCTVWETAWYLRGMENLMCDMMAEDEIATALLDKVTDLAVARARAYTEAGADAVFLGDDIGMQYTIMMSKSLYGEWLQPRLKRVTDAIHGANPDTIIFYHSCGHVTELIPQLIEAGIDVRDPVQPECMDFREIHDTYGDRLSFHGTIGTQSVMPFGTPEEVRQKVFENLDIAGDHGGLFVCPTHMVEPEVPLENLLAYIRACREYTA